MANPDSSRDGNVSSYEIVKAIEESPQRHPLSKDRDSCRIRIVQDGEPDCCAAPYNHSHIYLAL